MPIITIDSSELELLKSKAEKYDKLSIKMHDFYADNEANETDLGDIGEYIAIHFGYL